MDLKNLDIRFRQFSPESVTFRERDLLRIIPNSDHNSLPSDDAAHRDTSYSVSDYIA